ncbi:MAG: DUF4114 domain-containing protein [Sedimenticola sp.]
MKRIVLLAILLLGSQMAYSATWNQIINVQGFEDSGETVQVYKAINQLTGSTHTNNHQLGSLYVDDLSWSDLTEIALVGVSAGNTNELQSKTDATVSTVRTQPPAQDWLDNEYIDVPDVAGSYLWQLEALGPWSYGTWHSNDSGNSDAMDHMLAFSLGTSLTFTDGTTGLVHTFDNPHLIAWEDTAIASSDKDYNDMIYLVNAAPTPVPLPASVLLFGSGVMGLMGLAGFRRRGKRVSEQLTS